MDNNEKLEAISKAMAYIPQSMTDDNFVRNCRLKVAAFQKKNGKALVKIRKILGDNKYCETFDSDQSGGYNADVRDIQSDIGKLEAIKKVMARIPQAWSDDTLSSWAPQPILLSMTVHLKMIIKIRRILEERPNENPKYDCGTLDDLVKSIHGINRSWPT